jgi:hypothetical protein
MYLCKMLRAEKIKLEEKISTKDELGIGTSRREDMSAHLLALQHLACKLRFLCFRSLAAKAFAIFVLSYRVGISTIGDLSMM